MKTLSIFFFTLLFIACSSKPELSREEALNQLKLQKLYPKVLDYDLYCSDPEFARKALAAGIESKGLVTIQRTQKLGDVGKPLITITANAQPYLLPTSSKDKSLDVQKVKLADEDFVEVTAIKTENDGKTAIVDYTTSYKNLTPFSALTTINFNNKQTRKAHFSLTDDGWKIDK